MRLGFTGTRDGMTAIQKMQVTELVKKIQPEWAHHGDCAGADKEFHFIVRTMSPKTRIAGHPGNTGALRAYCECDVVHTAKHPLARNGDIVGVASAMIATPRELIEQRRGGTWSTIRLARKHRKPYFIVYPDGQVVSELYGMAAHLLKLGVGGSHG